MFSLAVNVVFLSEGCKCCCSSWVMASEEMQKVVLMNAWNWRESVVRRNNVKQQITAIWLAEALLSCMHIIISDWCKRHHHIVVIYQFPQPVIFKIILGLVCIHRSWLTTKLPVLLYSILLAWRLRLITVQLVSSSQHGSDGSEVNRKQWPQWVVQLGLSKCRTDVIAFVLFSAWPLLLTAVILAMWG